jgi:hypothetical protein
VLRRVTRAEGRQGERDFAMFAELWLCEKVLVKLNRREAQREHSTPVEFALLKILRFLLKTEQIERVTARERF